MIGFLGILLVAALSILFSRNARVFGPTLAIAYLGLISICINTYDSGTQADQNGNLGNSTGWFGDRWPIALLIAAITITLLHVRGRRR